MKKIVLVFLVLAMVACGEDEEVKQIELNTEFELNAGDTAVLSSQGISIIVENIADSRCPSNVQCVWEGEAKVQFRLAASQGTTMADSLSTHDRLTAIVNGLSIQLLGVTPYPNGENNGRSRAARMIITQD